MFLLPRDTSDVTDLRQWCNVIDKGGYAFSPGNGPLPCGLMVGRPATPFMDHPESCDRLQALNHVLVGHHYPDLATWPSRPAECTFTFDYPR